MASLSFVGFAVGLFSFSLVAEIGWLASLGLPLIRKALIFVVSVSLPRLGGWRADYCLCIVHELARFSLVAEIGWLASSSSSVVSKLNVARFSLVAEIGWLASSAICWATASDVCFSLVAEIGWLASGQK